MTHNLYDELLYLKFLVSLGSFNIHKGTQIGIIAQNYIGIRISPKDLAKYKSELMGDWCPPISVSVRYLGDNYDV